MVEANPRAPATVRDLVEPQYRQAVTAAPTDWAAAVDAQRWLTNTVNDA
jgi:hypothetical protein